MGWMDSLNAAAKAASKKKLNAAQSEEIAKDLVMMSSFGSALVTLVPIPLSDFVAVTAVQASMVTAIGRVYGRELNKEEAKHLVLELASVCGAGLVAQKSFATLTKIFLPGLGGVLAAPWAFGITWGMGHVAMTYFANREVTKAVLKGVFTKAKSEAGSVFTKEKFDEFRKKHGGGVEDFVRQEVSSDDDRGPAIKPKPKKKKKPAAKKKAAPPAADGGSTPEAE
ncbi:MAG: hypothetical protein H6Q89_1188 [Myxococcaceae bacterium]|nr:hypothetical protein [Myxococcaceae bacterium]